MELNINKVRKEFPSLNNEWIFMDNAGGSQILKKVVDRLNEYLFTSNVQLGASYQISEEATSKVNEANKIMADFINASNSSEVILGSSTSMLLNQLASSFSKVLKPGDEIIVTDCDHEANIGAWRKLERYGIVIKEWELNKEDLTLHLEDLVKIITAKTKLVAFTHSSNILGTINNVKEITKFIHDRNCLVCIDGVAYVPHRTVDVQDLDVDFYVFSFYKLYGPHAAILYGKQKHLLSLPGINHYFIEENDVPYKFQPGSQNYELSYSMIGVADYINEISTMHNIDDSLSLHKKAERFFELIQAHEEKLMKPVIDFLNNRSDIKIIGEKSSDSNIRVPTISFIKENTKSDRIVNDVDKFNIGIRYGHFYAKRLIDKLKLDKQNGVVRISLVHYNSNDEVKKLLEVLDRVL